MAAEGKAIIFYRCNLFFLFRKHRERLAMKSQPNLASRSEVVSIYKCLPKILGNLGHKKTSNFGPLFRDFALNTAYLRNETSHRKTKNDSVNLQCVP